MTNQDLTGLSGLMLILWHNQNLWNLRSFRWTASNSLKWPVIFVKKHCFDTVIRHQLRYLPYYTIQQSPNTNIKGAGGSQSGGSWKLVSWCFLTEDNEIYQLLLLHQKILILTKVIAGRSLVLMCNSIAISR